MNKTSLCQWCNEREDNNILTFDPTTGNDLDAPQFVCSICLELRYMQLGWVQDPHTGNWINPKLAEKNTGDVCVMCRAALHNQCEKQGCECEDC